MLFTGVLGLGLLRAAVSILSRVFLCMAVYKDSKEHDKNNSVMWTVLAALFGWIPVLIYVFLRYRKEKEMKLCLHCGRLNTSKYPVCMFCKQPMDVEKSPFISGEVKKFLILALVLFLIDSIMSLQSRININLNFV